MENNTELWTATEANKFIFKQLKQLLLPQGFIVCPKVSRYLMRVHDHHIEIVYQQILYGETRLQLIVVPSWTYEDGWCFHNDILLKRSNDPDERDNFYSRIAVRKEPSMKRYYKIDELMAIWNNVIVLQLQNSVIDYFNSLDFGRYSILCEKGGDRNLGYGYYLDSVRLFSVAYNSFWNKEYEKSKEFLEKAILVSEGHIAKGGTGDSEFQKDLSAGKEIYSLLKRKDLNWEKDIEDRLSFLEKDAMEKTWGIALDEEKNTIKMRKKKGI